MYGTTNAQNPFADPQPRSRSQPPMPSIPTIMMQPSDDDLANFEAITGCFDKEIATRFLQGAGNLQNAINYYFDNPNRYDTKSEGFDDSVWQLDRNGENGATATNIKSFQIESYDEERHARSSAPTRPPSPRDSLDVHHSSQENGVIGGSSTNYTSTFGPATREDYNALEWALTTTNQPAGGTMSVTEIIPDVEIPERVRINGEPVFIKPLGTDPLPALLTTLAQIPLAKKVMLEYGPHLADYGEDSSWWQGIPIPWATERVEIEWDMPDEEAHQALATQKQQDDAELIYETQRLMAFMHGSERLYGSAEPLSRLPAMDSAEKLPEVEDIQLEPMDQLDRFLVAWSSAMWNQASPEAQLFRIEIEAGKENFFPAFCLDVPIPSSKVNSGRTLYDKLDYILWYAEAASGSPMLESPMEDDNSGYPSKEWAETEMCFRRAPPILVIKLRPMVTILGSLGVDVPATLWLDRYMNENKEAAKNMRRNVLEVRRKIRKVNEQIDSLEMVSGQRDKQTRTWVNAQDGGVSTSMELLDRVTAYLTNKQASVQAEEESDVVDDLDLSSAIDEMDMGLDLETKSEHATSLASKLQHLQTSLQIRLSSLKTEVEELQKELESQSDLLKGPTLIDLSSPGFLSSDPTEADIDQNDGKIGVEASSSKTERVNQNQPKYKYNLRGVSTNSRNVFLRQGSEDDWPIWTRISWDLDGDINRQAYSEQAILDHIQSDSTMTLLIFASEEACKEQDIHLPDALQNFVDKDNIFFRIERGQIGATYGHDPLNPSPPNTGSPSSQTYEMLDSDQFNQRDEYQIQGEDEDNPPPYSSSAAAAAAAQAQAGLEMQTMNQHEHGLQAQQHHNQLIGLQSIDEGDEAEPVKVPISRYYPDEGEVQEIHLTERDVISSQVEGLGSNEESEKTNDVQMNIEDQSKRIRYSVPGESSVVAENSGTSTTGIGTRGSLSPTTSTSATMSGVKRSFED